MHPLQGYLCLVETGSQYNVPRSKNSQKKVLHLRKDLYALQQSSHVWYDTFEDFVISIGFMASRVNGGLFVLCDMEDHRIVAAGAILYVDDLLLIVKKRMIG